MQRSDPPASTSGSHNNNNNNNNNNNKNSNNNRQAYAQVPAPAARPPPPAPGGSLLVTSPNNVGSKAQSPTMATTNTQPQVAAAASPDKDSHNLPPFLLPTRKPKNFADRLMRVLLNDVAPDTFWWVGEGHAVAFDAKKLKKGNLLEAHFKTKDYNAFIRNCNRWGFSRTSQYAVREGVKVYHCSLFQRDAPHLMLQMRMDSDVQDVYTRHTAEEGDNGGAKKAKKQRIAPPESPVAAAPTPTAGTAPQQSGNPGQQQVDLPNLLQQLTAMGVIGGARTQAVSSSVQTGYVSGQTSMNAPAAPGPVQSSSNGDNMTPDDILNQILQFSGRFLNHPQLPASSEIDQLRTMMQLLVIQGKKYLEEKERRRLQQQQQQEQRERQQQQQQQQASAAMPSAANMALLGFLQSAIQQQQQQQQPTQPSIVSTATSTVSNQTLAFQQNPTSNPGQPIVANAGFSQATQTAPQSNMGAAGNSITPSPAVSGNLAVDVNNPFLSLLQGLGGGGLQQPIQQAPQQQRIPPFVSSSTQSGATAATNNGSAAHAAAPQGAAQLGGVSQQQQAETVLSQCLSLLFNQNGHPGG